MVIIHFSTLVLFLKNHGHYTFHYITFIGFLFVIFNSVFFVPVFDVTKTMSDIFQNDR